KVMKSTVKVVVPKGVGTEVDRSGPNKNAGSGAEGDSSPIIETEKEDHEDEGKSKEENEDELREETGNEEDGAEGDSKVDDEDEGDSSPVIDEVNRSDSGSPVKVVVPKEVGTEVDRSGPNKNAGSGAEGDSSPIIETKKEDREDEGKSKEENEGELGEETWNEEDGAEGDSKVDDEDEGDSSPVIDEVNRSDSGFVTILDWISSSVEDCLQIACGTGLCGVVPSPSEIA
ncbi:hypothetical protein U1Q18_017960, partial [Sarracenia purpurea var. burkii]